MASFLPHNSFFGSYNNISDHKEFFMEKLMEINHVGFSLHGMVGITHMVDFH